MPVFKKHIELVSILDNDITYHNYYEKYFTLELINTIDGNFVVNGSGIFIVSDAMFNQDDEFILNFSSKIIKKIVVKKSNKFIKSRISNLKKIQIKDNWIKSLFS